VSGAKKNPKTDEEDFIVVLGYCEKLFLPLIRKYIERRINVATRMFWKRVLGVTPRYWCRILQTCDFTGNNKARAIVIMKIHGHYPRRIM
jgi:hypothetical protein